MKRTLVLLCILTLMLGCLPPAFAAEDDFPYICDTELLLTDEEWTTLERRAKVISEQFACAVYFVTVENYQDYGSGSIYEVAKNIYLEYDLGWGEEKSGVLLLLSMYDRDYTLIAYGYGNTAFTDYGKDYLSEQFLDDFADNDWAEGCQDYLATCGEMLKMAREGNPLDIGSRVRTWHIVVASIVLGFLLALVICNAWSRKCKKKTALNMEAGNYLAPGGMDITLRDDQYSHTTQTRTKIERSSGSSGGTTIDSQGFSGKSGKF